MTVPKKVCVIGGGITGALTALRLTEAGYEVTVLEKKSKGNGASSRSAAACRQQFSTEMTIRGMRSATGFYRDFAKRYGCEEMYFPRGYLFLYRNQGAFAEAVEHNALQVECGLAEARVLTPDDVKKEFPYVKTDNLAGATWCPTDGFISPSVIYQTAFEAAERLGAKIIQNAEVTSVVKHGPTITKLVTPVGEFAADVVVNTTGIWSPRNAEKVLECTRLPIDPKKVYLYFLRRGAIDLAQWPFIATEQGAYCRQDNSAGLLMMGWFKDSKALKDFEDNDQDEIPAGYSAKDINGFGVQVWNELSGWLPCLDRMEGLATQTSGMYDLTPDRNPIIDYDLEVPNLIHAVGFSGHGAMHAPFTARIIEHLVRAETRQWTMAIDGEPQSLATFSLERDFTANAEKKVL